MNTFKEVISRIILHVLSDLTIFKNKSSREHMFFPKNCLCFLSLSI